MLEAEAMKYATLHLDGEAVVVPWAYYIGPCQHHILPGFHAEAH